MVKTFLNFSSGGRSYTAMAEDIFMHNGAMVVYIKNGKHSNPTQPRVEIGAKEWQRIKPQLMQLSYEDYYGRKPLVNGIFIYKVKQ